MAQRIQIRRDSTAAWAAADPVTPAQGELCLDTTTGELKIGDGVTSYADLEPFAPGGGGGGGEQGPPGADGREVELDIDGDYVVWRYVGDTEWTNLVALEDITGPAGAAGADGADGADGATGPAGVVAASAPITYNSGTQTVGIDQTGITIGQSQVTNLTTDLAGKLSSTDASVTDARTPTAHKTSHATGGTDALTASDIGAAASSHNHAASAITSGTIDIARIPTGTTSTTVPFGNDSRFSDQRNPIFRRLTFSDAAYNLATGPSPAVTTSTFVQQTGTLSAARTVTLPAAASVPAGSEVIINAGAGVTATNTVTISKYLDDTINGSASSLTIATPYGQRRFISDGVSAWVHDDGLLRRSVVPVTLTVAASDESTALTTGQKVAFRMPHAMTLTGVRASLTTASTSGDPLVDIKEAGTTIFSTKVSIDATEKTSTTAATAAVLSDTALADDAEITIHVDTAGTAAAGLKVTFVGTRSV